MADFFKWDPATLSVGVQEMDNEHIQLINRMNALHAAHAQKKDKAVLAPLLKDFVDYTVKHFADEEAWMEKAKYSGLDTHKIIHKQLLSEATKHVTTFQSTGTLTDPFFSFLSNWLTSHIRGIDMKYDPKKR